MKSKIFLILSLLVANFSLLTINNDKKVTKALEGYEEFAILKDGVWLEDSTVTTSVKAGASVEGGVYKTSGNWNMERVYLSKSIDLSSYEYIEFTYTSTSDYAEFGLANAIGGNDYHSAHTKVSLTKNGTESKFQLQVSNFLGKKHDICSWGDSSHLSTLDLSAINGFDFKTGGVITVSQIIAYKPLVNTNDFVATETMANLAFSYTETISSTTTSYKEFAILKDGVWLEDATIAPKTGASAAIADGIVTSTGDWTMDRVLFGKTIDLSSYEFVEFTYTSTNVTGGNIGFANTLASGEYHSAHSGWLTFSTTGENNTLRLNVSDFVLKDQDACSWGSCENLSTLDLTSIGGFDIKHGAGNITISEIIAYKPVVENLATYSNFKNVSMKFKYDFECSKMVSLLETGLIVTNNTSLDTSTMLTVDQFAALSADKNNKVFVNSEKLNSYIVGITISDEQLASIKDTSLLAVAYVKTSQGYFFNTAKVLSISSMLNIYKTSEDKINYEDGSVVNVSDLATAFLGQLG